MVGRATGLGSARSVWVGRGRLRCTELAKPRSVARGWGRPARDILELSFGRVRSRRLRSVRGKAVIDPIAGLAGIRKAARAACVVVCFLAPWTFAADGWNLVVLHPGGAEASEIWGGSGQVQVGKTRIAGTDRAALWRGSIASWQDSHPVGSTRSRLWATDGTQVVGESSSPDRSALFFSTSAASGTTFQRGAMFGAAGNQQVGQLISGSFPYYSFLAALWTGTSESIVILAPSVSGISRSMARGTDGVQQVGSIEVILNSWTGQSVQYASLWSGTASSWVQLSPTNSEAVAVYNGVQVGWESAEWTSPRRACLWRGSPGSWQSMHPSAASSSVLTGVLDDHQVGAAQFSGRWKAGIWSGSPESCVDLDTLLPPGFTGSQATSVWRDGDRLCVGGIALRENGWPYLDNNQAVMWWRAVAQECVGDLNSDTLVDDLDFSIFTVAYDILDCGDPAMPAGCPADLNSDGVVDDADFSVFVIAYEALLCP